MLIYSGCSDTGGKPTTVFMVFYTAIRCPIWVICRFPESLSENLIRKFLKIWNRGWSIYPILLLPAIYRNNWHRYWKRSCYWTGEWCAVMYRTWKMRWIWCLLWRKMLRVAGKWKPIWLKCTRKVGSPGKYCGPVIWGILPIVPGVSLPILML